MTADFQYDDYPSIVNNPDIKQLDLKNIWSHNYSRFITNLTFALNYAADGLNVFGWHLVNVLLHAFNAFLFYVLILNLLKTPILAQKKIDLNGYVFSFVAAILFLLHPIQTQAVIYTVQRSTLLATVFYLLTLIFYLKARLQLQKKYWIFAIALCWLGMLTKPLFVTLPVTIILMNLIFFEKDEKESKVRLISFVLLCMPLIMIPLILLGHQHLVELATQGFQNGTMQSHLLTQLSVIPLYARLFIAPIQLNIDYDIPFIVSLINWNVFLGLLLCFVSVFVAVRLAKTKPLTAFGILWIFITMSPVLIFPLADVLFEHWLYLPCIGFVLVLIEALVYFIHNKRLLAAAFVVICCVYTVFSYQRSLIWQNAIVFMEDAVQKSPYKARVHNNLGIAYFRNGEYSKAKASYMKSIHLDPSYYFAYNNIAEILFKEGKLAESQRIYEMLTKQYPFYVDPYINLSNIYQIHGNTNLVYAVLRKALQLKPKHPAARISLGNVFQSVGAWHEAKQEFQKVIYLKPESANAYYNLGNIFLNEKNYYEALFHYDHAIKIQPHFAQAHNNMGNIYFYFGDSEGAVESFKKAVYYQPDFASGYYNLANALYELGYEEESKDAIMEAVRLFEKQGFHQKADVIKTKILKITENEQSKL